MSESLIYVALFIRKISNSTCVQLGQDVSLRLAKLFKMDMDVSKASLRWKKILSYLD